MDSVEKSVESFSVPSIGDKQIKSLQIVGRDFLGDEEMEFGKEMSGNSFADNATGDLTAATNISPHSDDLMLHELQVNYSLSSEEKIQPSKITNFSMNDHSDVEVHLQQVKSRKMLKIVKICDDFNSEEPNDIYTISTPRVVDLDSIIPDIEDFYP